MIMLWVLLLLIKWLQFLFFDLVHCPCGSFHLSGYCLAGRAWQAHPTI